MIGEEEKGRSCSEAARETQTPDAGIVRYDV